VTSPLIPPNQDRRRRVRRGGRRRTAAVLLVGTLVFGVLLGALALQILQASADGRTELEDRQVYRVTLARQFIDSYVADALDRVRSTAEATVAGPDPTVADFALTTKQLRAYSAVLLDDEGRFMRVAPQRDDLIGQRLIERYPHLVTALDGRANVSGVVLSAATGQPVVAFATPFETPYGRRVLSVAFAIDQSPLGAFLRNFSSQTGNSVTLVDRAGNIIDTNGDRHDTLAEQDPALAAASGERASGIYLSHDGERFFATERTNDAPWQLVYSAPTARLFASVERDGLMPWLLFAGFAAAALTSVGLLAHVMHQRRQLVRLAERDALTGLYNRRHVDAQLERLARRSERDDSPLAVLLIDIDHFKQINDEHGHHRGDDVLVRVAQALRGGVREGDIACRWGGEEFMVLAPDATLDDAVALGDRLRRAVGDAVEVGGVPVTVSVGVAAVLGGEAEAATARADRALYAAKAAGRDRVVSDEADRPVGQPA
jgi:diguanylate cyclase (GGDEF)-like protein